MEFLYGLRGSVDRGEKCIFVPHLLIHMTTIDYSCSAKADNPSTSRMDYDTVLQSAGTS